MDCKMYNALAVLSKYFRVIQCFFKMIHRDQLTLEEALCKPKPFTELTTFDQLSITAFKAPLKTPLEYFKKSPIALNIKNTLGYTSFLVSQVPKERSLRKRKER